MITINRYSEHQYNNQPKLSQLYVLGKISFIEESRGGWRTGLFYQTGEQIILNTYMSRSAACESIGRDVVKYIGHTYQPIMEAVSPDWLKKLSDDIVKWHSDFFKLGTLNTINPYLDGIELEYTDSEYSEELDDLGVDHTLDTEVYIDIVFHGIPEDTERLITLGLQEVPDDYEINIFVEYSGKNNSIFGFDYKESKRWYFDQEDLTSMDSPGNTVNSVIKWCITKKVAHWVKSQQSRAMTRLIELATSIKKSRD